MNKKQMVGKTRSRADITDKLPGFEAAAENGKIAKGLLHELSDASAEEIVTEGDPTKKKLGAAVDNLVANLEKKLCGVADDIEKNGTANMRDLELGIWGELNGFRLAVMEVLLKSAAAEGNAKKGLADIGLNICRGNCIKQQGKNRS